ncbi:PD-(D/E)XK nuclease family transposase [Sphingobacterium sp. UBA1498]|uniref:PD-(D/E)XK nuclease family transposase n=1 Tax=Sphingobacterium sp. UBA1498 TaxID=1947481 RepID=UPI0039C9C64F
MEVQRTSQFDLKKRMLYYSSKWIADQAPKGNRRACKYAINKVYIIVLMFNRTGDLQRSGTKLGI